jgi:pantoate--beta-alanine ligase
VSIEEVRRVLARPRLEGRTIGFVPTMGALHEGHLSLVRESIRRTDLTVVSVFVNPTQFGAGEDFEAYPRDPEGDAAILAAEGADVLFEPTADVMYPPGAATIVDPGPLATVLCGAARPGHFVGVATVVVKLLGVVGPDIAFFGEKDYQQLVVIRSVVRDLDIPACIEGRPIVREPDGLALSSRNRYLTAPQRAAATVLYRALSIARDAAAAGESDAAVLERGMRATVDAQDGVELEYAVVVNEETLAPLARVDRPARALVAARVGTARLIDTMAIPAKGGGR